MTRSNTVPPLKEEERHIFAEILEWEEKSVLIDWIPCMVAPTFTRNQIVFFEIRRQIGNFFEGSPAEYYQPPLASAGTAEQRTGISTIFEVF